METKKVMLEDAIFSAYYYGVDFRRRAQKSVLQFFNTEKEARDFLYASVWKRKERHHLALEGTYGVSHEMRVSFLLSIREVEAYNPSKTYMGDWSQYHRPTSNGRGWVIVAPDEPRNNYYIEDKVILKLLKKKFPQFK